jgi:hypothetical protein
VLHNAMTSETAKATPTARRDDPCRREPRSISVTPNAANTRLCGWFLGTGATSHKSAVDSPAPSFCTEVPPVWVNGLYEKSGPAVYRRLLYRERFAVGLRAELNASEFGQEAQPSRRRLWIFANCVAARCSIANVHYVGNRVNSIAHLLPAKITRCDVVWGLGTSSPLAAVYGEIRRKEMEVESSRRYNLNRCL